MAIALPEVTSVAYLRALKEMGEIARLIQSESGDLSYQRINVLQQADARRRAAWVGLQEDVSAGFTGVIVAFLNDRGVAGTAGQINTANSNLTTAMLAWGVAVRDAAQSQSAADLIDIVERNANGVTVRTIEQKAAIPATSSGTSAADLRGSQALTDLDVALAALGA